MRGRFARLRLGQFALVGINSAILSRSGGNIGIGFAIPVNMARGIMDQLIIQAKAVGLTVVWSGVVAAVSYKLVDLAIGLRVSEEEEREGLDISSHGETAYSK